MTVGVHGDLPLAPEVAAQTFAEGLELGAYRYWHYRTGLSDEQTFNVKAATVFTTTDERTGAGVALGQTVGRGVTFARNLVNGPGYAMTPAKLADEAVALGQRLGLKVLVLDKAQLTEHGLRRDPSSRQGLGQRSSIHRDGVRRGRRGHADDLPGRQGVDL